MCVCLCVFTTACISKSIPNANGRERKRERGVGGEGEGDCMCGWRSFYLWTLQMSVFFDCLRLSVHFGMNFAKLSSRRLSGSGWI